MCLKIGGFLNTNSFFGCVVDEKIVKFGRKLEAEASITRTNQRSAKEGSPSFFGRTINWLEQRLEDLVFL